MPSQPLNARPEPAAVDLGAELQKIAGVLRRGWRHMVVSALVCLTLTGVYLARARREYQATARVLVLQQGGRPLNVGNNDPLRLIEGADDLIPTHMVILSSPVVVDRAIRSVGLERLPSLADSPDPTLSAINHLKIARPDRLAKILQIDYRAGSREEATRMVEALLDSYRTFLAETYQKNGGEVVVLITRARDELSRELEGLEKKYVEFYRDRPLLAKDDAGRSLIARRLDQWDRASNEVTVRAVQLRGQLELARRLAAEGKGMAVILQAVNQLGIVASNQPSFGPSPATDTSSAYLGHLIQDQHQLAEQYGPEYTKVKELSDQIERVQRRTREVQDRYDKDAARDLLTALEQGLQAVEAMRGELAKRFEKDGEDAKLVEAEILTESNLRQGMERHRALFNSVVEQLKQAQFVSDFSTVTAQVIERAGSSRIPVHPRVVLTLAIALAASVLLGVGAAFLADRLDPRIYGLEPLREALGLPVLGQVLRMPEPEVGAIGDFALVCHALPNSACAEAYRAARTNLDFLRRNRRLQVILMTSAHPGEGKSASSSNLAISLAQVGRKVLLIDADLRKPSQGRIHGVPNDVGLTQVLRGTMTVAEAAQRTSVPGLGLLTTGPSVPNPADLLASPRLGTLLDEARGLYDLVIIDSSPLLNVTDAALLGAMADGVILVARVDALKLRDVRAAREILDSLGVPVLGTVINAIGREHVSFKYGYGYGSVYGSGAGSKAAPGPVPGLPHAERSNGLVPAPMPSEPLP